MTTTFVSSPSHPIRLSKTSWATCCAQASSERAPRLLASVGPHELLKGTMLAAPRELACVYASEEHSFNHDSFFDQLAPLGGVPSLVLCRTENGLVCGGYTAFGFMARDDYRETMRDEAMFVFYMDGDSGQAVRAVTAKPVIQFDFADYAVRFGTGLLGVPMNPRKHVMAANAATSSCMLPDGRGSLFGDTTMTRLELLEVFVDKENVTKLQAKLDAKANGSGGVRGMLGRIFGM